MWLDRETITSRLDFSIVKLRLDYRDSILTKEKGKKKDNQPKNQRQKNKQT